MGIFSWCCLKCGNPILIREATNDINKWMNEAIAIDPNDELYQGNYDGYGKLDGDLVPNAISNGDFIYQQNPEDPDGPFVLITDKRTGGIVGDPSFYHRTCWMLKGQPLVYIGPSKTAPDQGYFFEEGTYDIKEPTFDSENI